MRIKRFVTAVALVGIAAAFALRAQTAAACQLCGTWILLDRIDRTAAGQIVDEPSLGADPVGIIVYDTAGNVSAQLMKRDRRKTSPAAASRAAQGSNNSAASNGYDAYFGRYDVDTTAHTVTHHVHGAIAASDVGKSLTRNYEFVGTELRLSFDTTNKGVSVRRTLRWRRAA